MQIYINVFALKCKICIFQKKKKKHFVNNELNIKKKKKINFPVINRQKYDMKMNVQISKHKTYFMFFFTSLRIFNIIVSLNKIK